MVVRVYGVGLRSRGWCPFVAGPMQSLLPVAGGDTRWAWEEPS